MDSVGVCALLLAAAGVFCSGALSAHELVSFEAEVKPILQRSCGGMGCHIGETQSGVELTSYEKAIASVGDQFQTAVIVPGDPDASPLIDKVSNATPKFGERMPFQLDPLDAADIAVLRRWIAEGARKSHTGFRGDVNRDDLLNITDAVLVLGFLFLGGEGPDCAVLPDANADGIVNLTDPVFVLNYLFLGGDAPKELSDEEFDACQEQKQLSFTSIYEKVLAASCAFTSCHSSERRKGDMAFSSREEAYAALVGVAPANLDALSAGYLRVDPGKPENSFLLKKLSGPGPGEGNRMPANSTSPLSDATIAAIREWILAGAPLEGTIPGVPDITDEPPAPTDRIPQPPVPENGVQLHIGPFAVGPRSEREVFFYVEKPFAPRDEDVYVKRIDVHMSEQSHHFILYQWTGASKPASGIRDNSFADFLQSQRFIVGVQQSYFSLTFPEGVGLKLPKDASFDLNSHYLNLASTETLQAEVYVNIFFADPAEVTTIAKPIFDINPFISVPPNQTKTTKWAFPGQTSTLADPAIGGGGRVSKETHIFALSSHMHRHGTRFTAFLIQNGVDVVPQQVLYDNPDWDDPLNKIFDPPLVLQPGQGIRFETTHTYDDPPSNNSPPLEFGPTSEDEMAILLGFYAIPK
ncbi:MAG TPA: c-type cytochrome domain-containing protein [Planctomycetota bacterium]|nr:c-type cytochrome domain-containing protein [Planctomycetota bacterium]